MKYEMIFGDEALFDGAPDDAEYAGWFCQETRWYMILNGKILFSDGGTWCTSDNPYLSADIAAMRRIIKEPNRWTWEDKKAGRLPEVGCRVDFCHKLNTNWRTGEIKYIDNQVAVIKADDIDRPFVYEFDRVEFKPIETPEEKAQRLRDDWINSSLQKIKRRNWTDAQTFSQIKEFIGDIYDAQLSGELQAPTKVE